LKLRRAHTYRFAVGRLLFLVGFVAALHGYVGWRIVPALADWPWAAWVLALTLVASSILMPLGFLLRRSRYLSWRSR